MMRSIMLLLLLLCSFPIIRGTTIVGLCCKDGIILGADTRSTGGAVVMDKHKHKIHHIASNIYCCGAGTSADCDHLTRSVRHKLERMRIDCELGHREGEVVTADDNDDESSFMHNSVPIALKLLTTSMRNSRSKLYKDDDDSSNNNSNDKGDFNNGFDVITDDDGRPQSVFIFGGYDNNGPSLYQIDQDGFHHKVPYTALGSGSMDAISILESVMFKSGRAQGSSSSDSMSVDDVAAVDAVRRAVRAGITNDLGSGSHVDICVVRARKTRLWRERSSDDRSYASSAAAGGTGGNGAGGDISDMRRLVVSDDDIEFL